MGNLPSGDASAAPADPSTLGESGAAPAVGGSMTFFDPALGDALPLPILQRLSSSSPPIEASHQQNGIMFRLYEALAKQPDSMASSPGTQVTICKKVFTQHFNLPGGLAVTLFEALDPQGRGWIDFRSFVGGFSCARCARAADSRWSAMQPGMLSSLLFVPCSVVELQMPFASSATKVSRTSSELCSGSAATAPHPALRRPP